MDEFSANRIKVGDIVRAKKLIPYGRLRVVSISSHYRADLKRVDEFGSEKKAPHGLPVLLGAALSDLELVEGARP